MTESDRGNTHLQQKSNTEAGTEYSHTHPYLPIANYYPNIRYFLFFIFLMFTFLKIVFPDHCPKRTIFQLLKIYQIV